MSEHKHEDLNEKYIRKDVYDVEKTSVKNLCEQRHKTVDIRLHQQEEFSKNINKKITATLVFTIITLIGIIVAIGTHTLT